MKRQGAFASPDRKERGAISQTEDTPSIIGILQRPVEKKSLKSSERGLLGDCSIAKRRAITT